MNHTDNFIRLLEHVKDSKHPYEVFNDWITMASISLYNSFHKDGSLENDYMKVAEGYTKDELNKMGDLLGMTVEALEDDPRDFLGEVFSRANFGNDRAGQFFTPYHVSYMMAEIQITDVPTDHIIRVSDPACGAGGMLIAAAMVLKDRGINYQHDAYFVGQDIDAKCCKMSFLQTCLLGIPAVIICGNTLTLEEPLFQWETIGYHLSFMKIRLEKEAEGKGLPVNVIDPLPTEVKVLQPELF